MAIVFYSCQGAEPTSGSTFYFCGAVPTSASATWNLKDSGAPVTNDEAASCILMDVAEGTIITLYDSPSGSTDDDYTTIKVLDYIYQFAIVSLEEASSGTMPVEINYHKKNGLNGKVSCIQVEAP